MSNGWIKLHRQITENPLYFTERFTKIQAWIDILIECNHKHKMLFIRGNEVNINRGQSANALTTWAKRWKWNDRTVKHFLNYLVNHQMIQYRTSHLTTVLTVVKYEQYQDSTEQTTEQTANRLQTNKNVKEIKHIVGYLNTATNSDYRTSTSSTQKSITARLNDGYSLEDFEAVIDTKAKEWLNTDMAKYLRPKTLFDPTKFEDYLQASKHKLEYDIDDHKTFKD